MSSQRSPERYFICNSRLVLPPRGRVSRGLRSRVFGKIVSNALGYSFETSSYDSARAERSAGNGAACRFEHNHCNWNVHLKATLKDRSRLLELAGISSLAGPCAALAARRSPCADNTAARDHTTVPPPSKSYPLPNRMHHLSPLPCSVQDKRSVDRVVCSNIGVRKSCVMPVYILLIREWEDCRSSTSWIGVR